METIPISNDHSPKKNPYSFGPSQRSKKGMMPSDGDSNGNLIATFLGLKSRNDEKKYHKKF